MKSESTPVGIAESGPLRADEPKKPIERLKKPLALVAVLGSLAVPSNQSKAVSETTKVGFSSNLVWNESEAVADAEAGRIRDSESDIIDLRNPYTEGGAENDNNRNRVCIGINSALDHGLTPKITIESHYRDGRLGYIPTTPNARWRYLTGAVNLFQSLVGENGCAKRLKKLYFSPFNEPNNDVFLKNQVVNGEWLAPEYYTELLAYVYPRLHAEANQLGLDLSIVGGDLAQYNSAGFIQRMKKVVLAKKIKGPLMDIYGQHFYINGPDDVDGQSLLNNILQMKQTVYDSFGNISIWYDEVGAISMTPKHKRNQYTEELSASLKPLRAELQGIFYENALRIAVCQKIGAFLIFHYTDDGKRLRSGVAYPDSTPKPSQPVVEQAFHEVRNGATVNC
jgi:hypothetical protein